MAVTPAKLSENISLAACGKYGEFVASYRPISNFGNGLKSKKMASSALLFVALAMGPI
ncbi:hypothetical protein NG798_05010 [Ancylothrix sp. C2]|nr:hypothetical protein [Ancylothrix sp. D3o]